LKVLQVSYRVPFPPTDGGTIGIYNITKGLSDAGCEVHTLSINTPKHAQPADALKGIATQYDVFVNTRISPLNLLLNYFFKEIPYNVERFVSADYKEKLQELLRKEQFDVIHLEGTFVAWYIDAIREVTDIPVIIRAHNIEYVIWERLGQHDRNPLKRFYFSSLARRIKAFEKKYYNRFSAVAAITPEDKQRLVDLGVTVPVEVVPAGVVVDKFAASREVSFEQNSAFILSALDWIPNQEALFWFLENVWPELHRRNPALSLHIAGKNTPEHIMNLNIAGVKVHGFVDDAVTFIKTYNLMLVPLSAGGGMRIKIIEGMAAGKCIITTTVGAEGIDYTDGKDIVICRSAEEWIGKISHYLAHDEARAAISAHAVDLVNQKYDNRTITEKYIRLYQTCLHKK
jgi:glycosyltransferase involved in cell wall biosynthesis